MWKITAIVCHYSLLPIDSSILSSKACTSSGRRRLCTKLWVIRPPSPFSHTCTLALVGSGLPSNWNLGCHAYAAWEEDAMPAPTWVWGSCMTIPLDGWGVIWVKTSPRPIEVCSATRCLFRVHLVWGGGGGGGEASDLGRKVVAAARPALHRAQSDQWSWSFGSPCLHYDRIQY